MQQNLLFPPFLNKGSKDLGLNGPVRLLQAELQDNLPGLAKKLRLAIDGNYGEVTATMVTAIQDIANLNTPGLSLETDGNFGPSTRQAAWDQFCTWSLRCDNLEFVVGGACLYVDPNLTEPTLWDPLGEDLPSTEEIRVPETTAGAPIPKD